MYDTGCLNGFLEQRGILRTGFRPCFQEKRRRSGITAHRCIDESSAAVHSNAVARAATRAVFTRLRMLSPAHILREERTGT